MFTLYESAGFSGRTTNTYVCMDADTRPTTGVGNGDKLIVMDTGSVEFFDADSETWVAYAPQESAGA